MSPTKLNRRRQMAAITDEGGARMRSKRLGAPLIAAVREADERRAAERLEAALRESEARFAGAFEHAPIGMALVGMDGKTRRVNRVLCQMFGYSETELLDMPVWTVTHPDDMAATIESAQCLLSGEENTWHLEKRFLHKQGQVVWALSSTSLIRDPDGNPLYFMSQVQDITERKQAEEVLRQSEGHFRSLIENALDLISILAADGTFQYASPSNLRVLGYAPQELVGRNAFEFVHPEDAPSVQQVFGAALQHPGVTPTVEFRFRHKDASWRFIEAIGNNLLDRPGVAGVVINSRDVTDRKRAAQARHEEAEVTAALARVGRELIAALDGPGLLDQLCRVTAEVLGCDSSHTLFWQPDEDVFRPIAGYGATAEERETALVMKVPRALMGGLLSRLEGDDVAQVGTVPPDLLSKPEQERFGVTLVLCMALRRGTELIGLQVAMSRDRLQPFSESQRRIARGIAQVASLALEHARIVSELEQANLLKSEFVATMSHELRTPLSVITGYTDLMLEGIFGALSSEQAETVQRIQRSSRELLDLITATLDLSRLEAGRMPVEMTDVNLADVIAQLKAETSELQEHSGLRIEWNVPADLPQLRTDATKVRLVLKNLIGNALKFTEQGTITVAAHLCDEGVEIAVTDTGIGIPAEVLPIIFDPFRQGDSSSTRRHGGVGLGLYIVRRLLDMLGGSVGVESEVGRGSTFRVRLPAETQK